MNENIGFCSITEDICRKEGECETCSLKHIYENIEHYAKLHEQGRLIELPCKVAATVYVADKSNKKVHPFIIESFVLDKYENKISASYDGKELKLQHWKIKISIERFAEVFSITKEEAEAKLAELKGE